MIIADFTLGHALLTVLSVFVFAAWILVLFTLLNDLFRDHSLSGWAKAAWVLFLIFIPFVTALVYLIVRGSGMRERALASQQEAQQEIDAYVRRAAGSSPAEELEKLARLRDQGTISTEEYERLKAKVVS